jgi:VWFA-related protein
MTRPPLQSRRPFWVGVIALAALVTVTSAQQPQVFRSGTEAVPLDVVVVDRDGKPVSSLEAANFTVTVDGQPRRVFSSQFLSSSSAGGPARPATAPNAKWDIDETFERFYLGNSKTASREAAPSRTIMIAIDQSSFSTAAGRNAAVAARGLLDMLHPDDRVGLAVFPPPGPSVRPTRDHERVRLALNQVTGSAEPRPRTNIVLSVTDAVAWQAGGTAGRQQIMERACGMNTSDCQGDLDASAGEIAHYAQRQTMIQLQGLINVLRSVDLEGTPSAIVVVSSGMYGAGIASQLGVDQEVRSLATLAAASRASLYALHLDTGFLERDSMEQAGARGFSTADGDLRVEGLRYLAGLSGGTVTRVAGVTDEAFRRVSLELSAYYMLGIEGLPSDRDGQRHRIRVRVDRPGTTVRAREELYLAASKKLSGDDAVRESLKAPRLERDLPIQLSTQMMQEPGTSKVRLVISAHIDRDVKAPASVRIGYSIRGAGAGATAATSEIENRKLSVVGSGVDASLAYVATASVTPGRYLLRLSAMDETNKLGSIEQAVDAMLVGGEGVAASDLLILDPGRVVKDAFAPVADGRITGDAVEAFLEVYPHGGQTVREVAFDISDTPNGPPIVTSKVVPEKKDGDRLSAGISIDTRTLPPGTYMLNARALDGERMLVRVSRPFRLDKLVGTGPRAGFAFAATGGIVRSFAREDALRSDAVEYFLARLRESDGTGTDRPAVGSAAAALRNARYDAVVESLSAEKSDALSVPFLRGLALLGQGKLEPAATELRAALRLSNDFLPAAFYLGACYAAGGHDREAAGAWQTSLISEVDSRIIYEVLADAWLRLKDARRAEMLIAEAQSRWPGDDVFAPRLAAAKVLQEKRSEAFGVLEPYVEKHPRDSEPLFLAIRLLYEAYDAGKPVKGAAQDKALAEKFGAMYHDAEGANGPLVARWIGAMTKK